MNTGSVQMEVCFMFPLPYDGAIDQLTLLVDGKEFPAKLLAADEARRDLRRDRPQESRPGPAGMDRHGHVQDERLSGAAGRRAQGHAALLAALPQGPGADRFSVPAEHGPNTRREPVEKLDIHVAIESGTDDQERLQPDALGRDQAARQQARRSICRSTNQIPTSDFRLLFDAAAGKVGASVVSYRREHERRRLLSAAGQPGDQSGRRRAPAAKTVVFVVDRSGSMSGEKIEQAKGR